MGQGQVSCQPKALCHAKCQMPDETSGDLGDGPDKLVLEAIHRRLDDPDWHIRLKAVENAAMLVDETQGHGYIVESLVHLLEDQHHQIRAGAAATLTKIAIPGDMVVVEALSKALEDPNCVVRRNAVVGLAKLVATDRCPSSSSFNGSYAHPTFCRLSPHVMQAASGDRNGSESAVSKDIARLLEDSNWEVRCHAAAALGKIATPADVCAVDALAGSLDDVDAGVRCDAVMALAKIAPYGNARASEALVRRLHTDSTPGLRVYVAEALAKVAVEGDVVVTKALNRCLEEDTSEGVRRAAGAALAEVTPFHCINERGVGPFTVSQPRDDIASDLLLEVAASDPWSNELPEVAAEDAIEVVRSNVAGSLLKSKQATQRLEVLETLKKRYDSETNSQEKTMFQRNAAMKDDDVTPKMSSTNLNHAVEQVFTSTSAQAEGRQGDAVSQPDTSKQQSPQLTPIFSM